MDREDQDIDRFSDYDESSEDEELFRNLEDSNVKIK